MNIQIEFSVYTYKRMDILTRDNLPCEGFPFMTENNKIGTFRTVPNDLVSIDFRTTDTPFV